MGQFVWRRDEMILKMKSAARQHSWINKEKKNNLADALTGENQPLTAEITARDNCTGPPSAILTEKPKLG